MPADAHERYRRVPWQALGCLRRSLREWNARRRQRVESSDLACRVLYGDEAVCRAALDVLRDALAEILVENLFAANEVFALVVGQRLDAEDRVTTQPSPMLARPPRGACDGVGELTLEQCSCFSSVALCLVRGGRAATGAMTTRA